MWIDEAGIEGGKAWRAELAQALTSSWVVVLLVTLESMLSKWVVREIEAADDLDKPIIPVIVEDVPYNDSLRIVLNRVQRVDAGGPSLPRLRGLDTALSAAAQTSQLSTPGRKLVVTGTILATIGWLGLLASLWFGLSALGESNEASIGLFAFAWLFGLPGSISIVIAVAGISIRRAGRKKGI